MIRPPTAPTTPPTAAPRAAPCPPAAAAPIAAPLPAPIRPPPIVRWTGSYGLVHADTPNRSPTATTQGVIRDLLIAQPPASNLRSRRGTHRLEQGASRTLPSRPTFRIKVDIVTRRLVSFLEPGRDGSPPTAIYAALQPLEPVERRMGATAPNHFYRRWGP